MQKVESNESGPSVRRRKAFKTKPQSTDTLGGFLALLRVNHNHTLADLARLSGLTIRTISSIEANDSSPRNATLSRLSKVLELPAENPKGFFTKSNIQEPDPNSFGALLKSLRLDRKYTVADLASDVGVTRQQIYNLEQNRQLPGNRVLEALVETLGFTPECPEEIIRGRGRPKKYSKEVEQTPTTS